MKNGVMKERAIYLDTTKVHGTFDDFGLGIGIARLGKTAISFITSPIHVPIRRIFSKKVAADGYDAYMAAWTLTDKESKVKSHRVRSENLLFSNFIGQKLRLDISVGEKSSAVLSCASSCFNIEITSAKVVFPCLNRQLLMKPQKR